MSLKIVLMATTSWNLYNSRLGFAKYLKDKGHVVTFLAPKDEFTHKLEEEGFRWKNLAIKPRGKNIFEEFSSLLKLIIFYRAEKPDIVNHFTPKGVIYGSIAAKIAGLNGIVNTITGLGVVFTDGANSYLRLLVSLLYPIALSRTLTVFQNPDDYSFFLESIKIKQEDSELIRSSGVDMKKFSYLPPRTGNYKINILLATRLVREKGVYTFVEASKILDLRGENYNFILVGKHEEDQPSSVNIEEIHQWAKDGLIEWWGWTDNIDKVFAKVDIACLPSYYREGIPKFLIEAAARGLPLIASDIPGCREIIINGENGFLIPIKDSLSLANSISKLSKNKELRGKMGLKSREIAENNFSIEKISESYYELFKKRFSNSIHF